MTDSERQIRAFFVERLPDGSIQRGTRNISTDDLPDGSAVVQVEWSSLNYKDGLAAQGHPGVARKLPHVPGIDAAGYLVKAPESCPIPLGSPVVVTGYELGAGQWGGWCEQIRVPAEWLVPLPANLTLRESMILGTAGFTAAQCVRALLRHDIAPESGPIAVSGATGGVGCLSVLLLSQLGYRVVAATGKADATQWLRDLGASQVVDRSDFLGDVQRPLLSTRFAGAIDTVGGETLSGLLRATQPHGCVAACGLVGGHDLALTVYPFIIRGVALDGITSSMCPPGPRLEIWRLLANEWKPRSLDQLTQETDLAHLESHIQAILAGQVRGRVVVHVAKNGGARAGSSISLT